MLLAALARLWALLRVEPTPEPMPLAKLLDALRPLLERSEGVPETPDEALLARLRALDATEPIPAARPDERPLEALLPVLCASPGSPLMRSMSC